MTHPRRVLLAILLVSVALRVGAALYLGDQVVDLPGTADQLSYHNLAQRVLGGYGFTFSEPWWPLTAAGAPTAHWSYLYTFYLVAVYALFGPHPLAARLIQAVLVGVLHPYLTYRLARAGAPAHWPTSVPLLAAAWAALYGYFIYYAATLMTEPFYITAILAALWAAVALVDRAAAADRAPVRCKAAAGNEATARSEATVSHAGRRWAWGIPLGLTLAAAVLLRQLFLLCVPLIFLWIAVAARCSRRLRQMLPALGVAAALIVLAIVPFTLFNYARFGRVVLLNTNAGYAFFWGNHPIYGDRFISILPEGGPTYQDLIPSELRRFDEAALDQALLARAIDFIIADPARYLRLSLSRIPAYFMFWPDPDSGLVSNLTRVGSFGLSLPFMIYGLWRSLRAWAYQGGKARLAAPTLLLYLFVLTYTAIHLLTWALIRYRLPVDAVLILFAAFGLSDLATRVRIWRGAGE